MILTEIFWASGACFFIRSKVYHQLNGFDEDYFAHQEEIDLCWRTQNNGYKIKYVGTLLFIMLVEQLYKKQIRIKHI